MSDIRPYFDYDSLLGRYKRNRGIVIKAEPSPVGGKLIRIFFDNKSFSDVHIEPIYQYFMREKIMVWEKEQILKCDYFLIKKDLNIIVKESDNIYSWQLENRPLMAARNINELIKAVIENSPTVPIRIEYRKDEFRLKKIRFIEFSLAEELEFRSWRREGIRNLTPKKILRYWLWLLIPRKAKNKYLARFTAWAYVISFLERYSDFLEFSDGAKISEYETLMINWRQ